MVTNFRMLGATLLVAGTTIGAGMLVLPITTGIIGFYPSLLIFLFAAAFMLYNLLLLLEVNLWLPKGSDIISMVKTILGKHAGWLALFVYLGLFYSVMSAYISAGNPYIRELLQQAFQIKLTDSASTLLLVFVLAFFLYLGTKAIDNLNRLLMTGLVICFIMLISFSASSIDTLNLTVSEPKYVWSVIPVIVLSFTSHLIVPSLREYLKEDRAKLTKVLIFGSLIPLVIYIVWQFVILGVLSNEMMQYVIINDKPLVMMTNSMATSLGNPAVSQTSSFFIFFAVITSLLGVSISLFHLMSDYLNTKRTIILLPAVLALPTICVLFYNSIFVSALKMAGICIIVLFSILTILMTWKGRYIDKRVSTYKTPGGKITLASMLIVSVFILFLEFSNVFFDWLPDAKTDLTLELQKSAYVGGNSIH